MKREFTTDDFEEFLKQNADSLRMKAPDKVWQNLSKELNKRRRRFFIGLSTFILLTSAVGYYTITHVSQPADILPKSNNREQGSTLQSVIEKTSSIKPSLATPEKGFITVQTLQRETFLQNSAKLQSIKASTPHVTQTDFKEKNDVIKNGLVSQSDFIPTIIDSYTEFDQKDFTSKKKEERTSNENEVLPLTIESVVNAYKLRSKKRRIETQVYFVPTISYRKLTENKSYLRTLSQSNAANNYPALNSSVNNYVTHKPDIGFELGFAVKYPVSSKLKLRTGVQFNVNRYDVKAFSSSYSVATIALNNRSGPDSLNTISNYSNINGYKSNWLQNLSFQISAPIGAELTLGGTNKIQFGIGGSIQPTYVIGDRAYLITTDYKSYAQVPWLTRRWNANTAFETFVVYNSGKTKWQVSPQVRYQLLSSFISEYPVKENLFDFGLKIGISLNNK